MPNHSVESFGSYVVVRESCKKKIFVSSEPGEQDWGVDFLLIIPGLITSCKIDQSYILVSTLPSLDSVYLHGTGLEMQVFLIILLTK